MFEATSPRLMPDSKCDPPGGSQPQVAVSILNWNGWRDTIECVRSIRELDYPHRTAVVVDNGSSNDSLDNLRSFAEAERERGAVVVEYGADEARQGGRADIEERLWAGSPTLRIVLVRSGQNLGFPGGHNLAIHYLLNCSCPPDHILLLNNDATLDPQCVSALVATAAETGAGVVGTVFRNAVTGNRADHSRLGSISYAFFAPPLSLPKKEFVPSERFWTVSEISGAAMLLSKRALACLRERTGRYLDDGLFLYCEENELCCRLRQCGYKAVVCSGAIVTHGEASSSGGRHNPIAYYYTSRNRILLAGRLLPFFLKAPFHILNLTASVFRISKCLCAGRFSAALAVAEGVLDGYAGKTGKWDRHDAVCCRTRQPAE